MRSAGTVRGLASPALSAVTCAAPGRLGRRTRPRRMLPTCGAAARPAMVLLVRLPTKRSMEAAPSSCRRRGRLSGRCPARRRIRPEHRRRSRRAVHRAGGPGQPARTGLHLLQPTRPAREGHRRATVHALPSLPERPGPAGVGRRSGLARRCSTCRCRHRVRLVGQARLGRGRRRRHPPAWPSPHRADPPPDVGAAPERHPTDVGCPPRSADPGAPGRADSGQPAPAVRTTCRPVAADPPQTHRPGHRVRQD